MLFATINLEPFHIAQIGQPFAPFRFQNKIELFLAILQQISVCRPMFYDGIHFAGSLHFLIQFIENFAGEKLSQRDFQTITQLFDGCDRDSSTGRF